jgi:hypothetical protein
VESFKGERTKPQIDGKFKEMGVTDLLDSIITGDMEGRCIHCGRYCVTHKHHIFGAANRKWSEKYGLFIHLCPEHHNMSREGIHFNKDMMDRYHEIGQREFERWYREKGFDAEHARHEFMRIFGRNYL